MKYLISVFLLAGVLPLSASEPVILVLGDSLSAAFGIDRKVGWVSLLQKRLDSLGGDWQVVNAGISGDTTAGGLSRLPRLLELHRPQLVVLELGSNDGLRGFGFDQIRSNLQRMISLSRDAGADVLLVGARLPPNYGAAYADSFHQLFLDVAEREQVALVPFLLEGVARDPSLMQADGYHPNAAAQPRLLENVWPQLEPLLTQPSQ